MYPGLDHVTSDSEYTKTLIQRIHGSAYRETIRVPGWVDQVRFKVCAVLGND